MRKYLIAISAILVAFAFISNAEEQCTPGELIKRTDLCKCFCGEDGKTVICPSKGCPGRKRLQKRDVVRCRIRDTFEDVDNCFYKCIRCYFDEQAKLNPPCKKSICDWSGENEWYVSICEEPFGKDLLKHNMMD